MENAKRQKTWEPDTKQNEQKFRILQLHMFHLDFHHIFVVVVVVVDIAAAGCPIFDMPIF